MRILLSGSTGFIGHNLKEAWEDRYDLCTPDRGELDLLDAESVEQYLKNGRFDVVIHAANMNAGRRTIDNYQILDGNLRMFGNLERCRKLYGKLLYFGSGAEYDARHYIPNMPESYFGTHIPADPYGFSKYIMSKLAGGNIYDLRLFGVFGKYEEWKRRFISNMIYQSFTGRILRVNQNMCFDYLYIEDLISVLEWFLTHEPKHHHYNVCSGRCVDLLSLAKTVIEITGRPADIEVAQDGWKLEYTGDNTRLLAETRNISLTPMPVAIQKMVSYYQNIGFQPY